MFGLNFTNSVNNQKEFGKQEIDHFYNWNVTGCKWEGTIFSFFGATWQEIVT